MFIDFSSAKFLIKDANGSGDILFSPLVGLSIRPSDCSSQNLVNAIPPTVLG